MQLQSKEKIALLQEFNSLPSIAEKTNFWLQKLKNNYYYYVLSFSNYASPESADRFSDLHDFKINATEKQDIVALNNYLIDFYKLTARSGSYKATASNFSLQEMINEIEYLLEESNNKIGLLELELNNVNAYISNRSQPENELHKQLNAYFNYGYKNYLLDKKEVDISKSIAYDFQDLIAELDGVVIAKFQEYIKSKIEKVKNDKPRKIEPLSLEEQFLALEYLDVLNKLDKVKDPKNTEKGKFIALLIGKDQSNCRGMFSSLGELKRAKTSEEKRKSIKRLTRVYLLFEEVGLKSIAKKIDVDIKKLSQ